MQKSCKATIAETRRRNGEETNMNSTRSSARESYLALLSNPAVLLSHDDLNFLRASFSLRGDVDCKFL